MDTTVTDGINLNEIPVQALRLKTREKLSSMLNKRKLISSPEGLCRDYRGLADLMEICIDNCWTPNNDPIAILLEKSRHSLCDLQTFLQRIDRFDVLDDCRDLFNEDAVIYSQQKNQNSALILRNENDYLTIDDIMESRRTYDAFLLYVDEDMEFAKKIVNILESDYNLKICVKDLLLGGSIFEHNAIMKLISERCHRLIVLLSDEFVSSDKDTFFLDFAQFLSLEKENKRRFIIPVKYKTCNLPEHYLVYFILDYMRHGMITNFWERLYASILPAPEEKNNRIQITDVSEGTTIIQKSTPQMLLSKEKSVEKTFHTPISSSMKSLPDVENTQPEIISNASHHKTVKSKLSKFFKRLTKNKPKKIAQSEVVACVS